MAIIGFNVWKGNNKTVFIDTVYYSGVMTVEDVKRDLIEHDGYDSDILVEVAENVEDD